MGELINLNPPKAITDADIPAAIARDAEYIAADTAHTTAADPHPIYLTQTEGDGRYRQTNAVIRGISGGTMTSELNNAVLQAEARDSLSAAYIFFHRPGIFGVHLGINTNNELCIGGWSLGNTSYKIFHEGLPSLIKAALPAAYSASNSCVLSWNSVQLGQGIAELCNYAGSGGGDAVNFFRMPGNDIAAPTISNRVSRIDINGAYIQTSDRRLKSGFMSAPGLSVILGLLPQKYQHWECTGINQNKQIKLGKNFTSKIGFVAQEVAKILPEAVPVTTSEEELYGLDYSCILTCAVRAIQELNEQVVDLRAQLQKIVKA